MRFLVTANYTADGLAELTKLGSVDYDPWVQRDRVLSASALIDRIRRAEADVLITEVDPISAEVLNDTALKAIGVCRGNPVNVDVAAATRQGIPVFRTPGRNAQAVAELGLVMIISLLRRVDGAIRWVREGHWTSQEMSLARYRQFQGHELWRKTIGFVGFGAVGQTLARLLGPFQCALQYYDPYVVLSDDLRAVMHVTASLPDLFASSDVVSVHLPVTPATRGLIGRDLLERMQPQAVFVNTARAAVIDRTALVDILQQQRIAGAALDVFDHEPLDDPDDQVLAFLPNVLPTPHIGGATHEVAEHQAAILNQALQAWFRDRKWDPATFVNPSSVDRKNTATDSPSSV